MEAFFLVFFGIDFLAQRVYNVFNKLISASVYKNFISETNLKILIISNDIAFHKFKKVFLASYIYSYIP